LSQADALSQLLQSLDEATSHPTEDELSELFGELRPKRWERSWLAPQASNERVSFLVQTSAERLAVAHAAEVLKALASADPRFSSRWSGCRPAQAPRCARGHGPLRNVANGLSSPWGGADDDRSPGATRLLEKPSTTTSATSASRPSNPRPACHRNAFRASRPR